MTAQIVMAMLAGKLVPMMQDITKESLQEDLADLWETVSFEINDNMELVVTI